MRKYEKSSRKYVFRNIFKNETKQYKIISFSEYIIT